MIKKIKKQKHDEKALEQVWYDLSEKSETIYPQSSGLIWLSERPHDLVNDILCDGRLIEIIPTSSIEVGMSCILDRYDLNQYNGLCVRFVRTKNLEDAFDLEVFELKEIFKKTGHLPPMTNPNLHMLVLGGC